jgi:hypothetical protein
MDIVKWKKELVSSTTGELFDVGHSTRTTLESEACHHLWLSLTSQNGKAVHGDVVGGFVRHSPFKNHSHQYHLNKQHKHKSKGYIS